MTSVIEDRGAVFGSPEGTVEVHQAQAARAGLEPTRAMAPDREAEHVASPDLARFRPDTTRLP